MTPPFIGVGLVPGEAIEKTSVSIACIEGKEAEVIDDVAKFFF